MSTWGRSPPVSAAAVAVTSAMPRRICDKITPELPRAPFSAPADSAAAARAAHAERPCAFSSANAERIVNSMLAPVSESATGKTLSRLISSMWVIRSLTAVCAQSRRVIASNTRSCVVHEVARGTHLLCASVPRRSPPGAGARWAPA